MLFNTNNRQLIQLNSSSVLIWQHLQKGSTEENIAHVLSEMFTIPYDVALTDCKHMVSTLVDHANSAIFSVDLEFNTSDVQLKVNSSCADRLMLSFKLKLAGRNILVSGPEQPALVNLQNLTRYLQTDFSETDFSITIQYSDGYWQVYTNEFRTHHGLNDSQLLERVCYEVVECAYRQRDLLALLHGAAIGRSGKAVILMGKAGSGKSTLTALLQKHRWQYLSDDISMIDTINQELIPLPFVQAIKSGSWSLIETQFDDFRHEPATERLGKNGALPKAGVSR